jgi:hypothetical protein
MTGRGKLEKEIENKLREMVHRHEIWQVMQRYGRGLDRLDVDLVRSCYFDDCIEDHGHYVGDPDGFIEWANNIALQYESTQHAVLNHYCELDGDDAHCETYFHFTAVLAEPPHFMSTGRYIDHFQRRNGEWRIANRVTIVEGTYDIDESAASKLMPPAYGPDEVFPATRDRNDVSYQRPVMPRRPR